jgi:anti-sigma B factor antagonist
MKISTRLVGDVTILDLKGRITLGEGAVTLRDAVRELVDGGARKILLNMSLVNYIDSAGNGELASAFTITKYAGGDLRLLNPCKKVNDLLQVSKLYRIYQVVDDEGIALESFKQLVRFRCECPICGDFLTSFGAPGTGGWPAQSCGICRLHFSVSPSSSGREVNVVYLTIQTYGWEQIRVSSDPFLRVSIDGRLDLFSLTTLKKIWDKIPGRQKVIVDLSCTKDIDDDGWEGLHLLLQSTAERIEAAVSLQNAQSKIIAGRVIAPPIYVDLAAAREALGNDSSKLIWHVNTLNFEP